MPTSEFSYFFRILFGFETTSSPGMSAPSSIANSLISWPASVPLISNSFASALPTNFSVVLSQFFSLLHKAWKSLVFGQSLSFRGGPFSRHFQLGGVWPFIDCGKSLFVIS